MSIAGPTTIAALLLAVWFDWRLENRRPESPTRRIVHALAAYLALRAITAGSKALIDDAAADGERLAVFFVLVLPSLVYAFVAALWLMRTLADVARTARL